MYKETPSDILQWKLTVIVISKESVVFEPSTFGNQQL